MDEYYKILGLSPGASKDEIRRAYRQLAKVWHPDRFPGDPELQQKGAEKFREINEAFEKLKHFQPSKPHHRAPERQAQPAGAPPKPGPRPKPPHGTFKFKAVRILKIVGAFYGFLFFWMALSAIWDSFHPYISGPERLALIRAARMKKARSEMMGVQR